MRELQAVELCFVSGGGPFCGPQDSWAGNFVPDAPFGFNFGPACQLHDLLYADGSVARSTIDSWFLEDMLTAANGNAVGVVMAYVYYGFVSVFGDLFYGGANAAALPDESQAGTLANMAANDLAGNQQAVFDFLDLGSYDSSFTQQVGESMGYAGGGGRGDSGADPWTVPHAVPVDPRSNEFAMA